MKAALGVDRTADLTKIEGTKPSHALKDYTGVYEHPGYGEIKIELKDGVLQALFNSFVMPLKHYHYNIFEMKMPLTGDGDARHRSTLIYTDISAAFPYRLKWRKALRNRICQEAGSAIVRS